MKTGSGSCISRGFPQLLWRLKRLKRYSCFIFLFFRRRGGARRRGGGRGNAICCSVGAIILTYCATVERQTHTHTNPRGHHIHTVIITVSNAHSFNHSFFCPPRSISPHLPCPLIGRSRVHAQSSASPNPFPSTCNGPLALCTIPPCSPTHSVTVFLLLCA